MKKQFIIKMIISMLFVSLFAACSNGGIEDSDSYRACLEENASLSESSVNEILVCLAEDVVWEDFAADYDIEPTSTYEHISLIGYTVEPGTQAEWICTFLEDSRAECAELAYPLYPQ